MQLYTYFRSSAAYRVRIALNLKKLDVEYRFVHLVRDGGEQHAQEYQTLNPQELVPTLIDGDTVLTQSLAIIEYLDECHPTPPLLPANPAGRARVRALAQLIACEIHPLNNLRVLQYLDLALGRDAEERKRWYRHWVMEGFTAFERLLTQSEHTGKFCHGGQPTLADLCLVPQLYNARRYECDLRAFPEICRIGDACMALDAFSAAAPENQPDAA
jgi:maleylpyruvate isomerase